MSLSRGSVHRTAFGNDDERSTPVRAVLKSGPQRGVEYTASHPEPEPGPGEVLLEVGAASVCGTDRELFEWGAAAEAFGLELPVVLGHELAGTVIAAGPGVNALREGDRVALESHVPCGRCFPCRTGDAHNCANLRILGMHVDGGFAQRMAAPVSVCFPLPESVALETGALLEPAGVAMHAIQRSGMAVAGGVVLVNGCGPVGLVIAELAALMGAAHVVAVEPNPYRRGLAERTGALALHPSEDVAARCRELSGSRQGADVAFEVSAARGVYPALFDAVRREGVVIGIGHPAEPTPIDVAASINKKGVTLRGVFGRRLWDTWEQMLLFVTSGRLDLGTLVTHRLALSQLPEAIELLDGEACKVMLDPSLEGAPAATPAR
jgi:threonine 3-dehydrogenase